jgi:hypothetical protein
MTSEHIFLAILAITFAVVAIVAFIVFGYARHVERKEARNTEPLLGVVLPPELRDPKDY